MSSPAIVAICGSCGTRDAFNSRFNPDYKRFFRCDLATNQSSLIALMSPPVEPVFEPLGEMTPYDRWNVASDMSREFLGKVATLRPAYLVLDFFGDIHFGVLRLRDGRYLTANRWKLYRTDVYQQLKADMDVTRLNIFDDTDAYLALWRESMDRFAAHIGKHCPDTTVIVHRGYNTNLVQVPGAPRPMPLAKYKPTSPLDVPRANELWGALDDYCIDTFGWESIDLREEGYTSYAEHPWGPFYVHYTMDYYHRFLAELHKIHLRHTGIDEELWARLGDIEDAVRENGLRRLSVSERTVADQDVRLARQRGRIVELESLGPITAVKFALGQRIRKLRATTRRRRER